LTCTASCITVWFVNRLSMDRRSQILSLMVEGVSLRAISRLTGTGKNTLARLLSEFGSVCAAYHNWTIRSVRVRCLQCDEVWSFIGAKAKNTTPEKKAEGWGDTWTWTASDAASKLCVSYLVGGRGLGWAKEFMEDCASRIHGRVQVTTDGHKAYLEAVEGAFGMDVDYAQLQKIYGAPSDEETRRYSPARCIGSDMKVVSGNPDPKHISTSYVERQNLSMRMGMRRFTRLTNGFSKKIDNHIAAGSDLFHALQFLPHSSDTWNHSRDGGRDYRSCLVRRRSMRSCAESGKFLPTNRPNDGC
jgi:IS1 family transposase